MSTKRSYKAEFLRWKAEVEKKHGKMIYDRLSEVIDTDDDLAVGDTVLFTNDSGTTRQRWECMSRKIRLDWRVVILRYTDMFSTPIHRLTHLDWIVTK